MTTAVEASMKAAIEMMARIPAVRFWRTMHDLAVTAAVSLSESKFAQLESDMQDSAFEHEPWLAHVEAVATEAARLRKSLS